eukprot:COSAG04_NODE_8038_length_1031_cov_1.181330_2_plen_257_part_00
MSLIAFSDALAFIDTAVCDRNNVAYVAGGAIRVLGAAVSTLVVDHSVFESNAVHVPADGGDVDVTLRLNTGSFEIGVAMGSHIPIWRIDDGPVYGIPWELCQYAVKLSDEAVGKGFPASFPGDLQCANVSYTGPDSSFSRVVPLSQGTHTLWTGVLAEVTPTPLSLPLYHNLQHRKCLADWRAEQWVAASVDRACRHHWATLPHPARDVSSQSCCDRSRLRLPWLLQQGATSCSRDVGLGDASPRKMQHTLGRKNF